MEKISSYQDLIVWQRSVELAIEMYSVTENFPKGEIYGITSQMRRASVSISSNIAEGSRRTSRKDFKKFLCDAYGSGAELETQVLISKKLPFGKSINFDRIDSLLGEVMRMLNGLIKQFQD